MKLLAIALCAGIASASFVQLCSGFEGPSGTFTPVFEVETTSDNTSLLLVHFSDLKEKFIDDVDIDIERTIPDGAYPICTNISSCMREDVDMINPDDYVNKELKFPMVNGRLVPGEKVVYSVPASGVYCALVYQPGSEKMEDVEFKTTHSYGDYPLTAHQGLKLIVALIVWYILLRRAVPWLFPKMKHAGRYYILKAVKYSVLGKLSFGIIHLSGAEVQAYTPTRNSWFMLDQLLGLVVTCLVLSVLDGVFSVMYTGSGFSPFHHPNGKFVGYYEQRAYYATLLSFLGFAIAVTLASLADSATVTMVVADILPAFVALVLSSSPGSHTLESLKKRGIVMFRGEDQENLVNDLEKQVPIEQWSADEKEKENDRYEGIARRLRGLSKVVNTHMHQLVSEDSIAGQFFNICIYWSTEWSFLFFCYAILMLTYLFAIFATIPKLRVVYSHFRETRPSGAVYETELIYHHVIGLNVFGNTMWSLLKTWFGAV